jgi:alkylhydroperoxidase/carboxymuconolactone decarboxylase family protein
MSEYYKHDHLQRFGDIAEGNSELAKKFFDYYGSVFADGALSVREKALIALAVAHSVQCAYCIDAYSTECLKQGADLEQMTEAVHVATAIRGGASLVHGLQMLEHVEESSM